MPEMDGLQATIAIRQLEQATGRPATPIVAMTAYAAREDREKCLQAGMDDYLSKPVKPASILATLQRHCDGQRVAQQSGPPELSAAAENQAAKGEVLTPVYAREDLLERLGGEEALIPRFISLFRNGLLKNLQELEQAITADDSEAVRVAAHTIKGSCGNIGAMQMRETASTLEAAAKAGDIGEVPGP